MIQGLVNVDSLCRIKREHSIDQVVELLAKRIGGLNDCLKKKTGGGSAPASEFRHDSSTHIQFLHLLDVLAARFGRLCIRIVKTILPIEEFRLGSSVREVNVSVRAAVMKP